VRGADFGRMTGYSFPNQISEELPTTAWNRCDQFLEAVFTSCINLCRHHSCVAFWQTTLCI
jgi:hypothetical protein